MISDNPKIMKAALFFLIIYFFGINVSYAYIDPGTGSIIFQAIIALVAAIGAAVSLYWNKLKNFITIILKKKNKDQ